ncbi:homoserine O-acetyltransferase/O-succinyltransferase family protein [Liquorilactobacillus sp.]|uniref:homoserine O-acetyltransferase/O-succinyltransferase family protein n=1 Tax=Liquorilactobacillus sp. TaxID=2767923 RepID=UPI0039ED0FCA
MAVIYITNGFTKNTNTSHPETLAVLLINLMPDRAETERQFVSLLKNSRRDITLTFCLPKTHTLKNNARESLEKYATFDEVSSNYYDALIITGAPLDRLNFTAVDYWNEFSKIINWRKTHANQSLFICWSAYAAGEIDGIFKGQQLTKKIAGVYTTNNLIIPHSRYFTIPLCNSIDGKILAGNTEIGAVLIQNERLHSTYLTGHLEYQTNTLAQEYKRDSLAGLAPHKPNNYFDKDDIPINTWNSTANSFYRQWLDNIIATKVSTALGKE